MKNSSLATRFLFYLCQPQGQHPVRSAEILEILGKAMRQSLRLKTSGNQDDIRGVSRSSGSGSNSGAKVSGRRR
ncbi:hypothetical protein SeMB42_g04269 [Synchytrium endobioticum]|uniref:Uncharacterized protein n=1 Tax=Synchytrium endobioticum TaxID=286115 RepID=A0A507CZW5_9FUNG|nr:hypothetical protein SeMB42_g04269 [Synchytrium endobioticum]